MRVVELELRLSRSQLAATPMHQTRHSFGAQRFNVNRWLLNPTIVPRVNRAGSPGFTEEAAVAEKEAVTFAAAVEIEAVAVSACGIDSEAGLRAFVPLVGDVADPHVAVGRSSTDVAA